MQLWVKHFLWVIGMALLLIVSSHFEHQVTITAQQTYRLTPEASINTAISFVLGIYLSLLFLDKLKFEINKPLLVCVFIPCAIIGFYVPVAIMYSLPFPVWESYLNTHGFPTVLSGLSLMLSLFNGTKNKP